LNCGRKRENAGRPIGQGKYGQPTVSIRVPQSQSATVKEFLTAFQHKKSDIDDENVDKFFTPLISDQQSNSRYMQPRSQ
jgi:DNA polymerase V